VYQKKLLRLSSLCIFLVYNQPNPVIHPYFNQSINRLPGLRLSERNEPNPYGYCISINPIRWNGKGKFTTAQRLFCTKSVHEAPREKVETPNTTQATFILTAQQLVANQHTLLPDAENQHGF